MVSISVRNVVTDRKYGGHMENKLKAYLDWKAKMEAQYGKLVYRKVTQ